MGKSVSGRWTRAGRKGKYVTGRWTGSEWIMNEIRDRWMRGGSGVIGQQPLDGELTEGKSVSGRWRGSGRRGTAHFVWVWRVRSE